MDEKIEVNNKTVIDLAKIIHKHYQHIQADWEEYTKSDVALAYAIKWNGYRKESDTARECLEQFICRLVNARLVGVNDDLYYELLEAKDDLVKEKYEVNNG